MTKISHPDYFLPVVEAIEGNEVLLTGTTEPMLIRGICRATHEKSDYVVKYLKSPRMSVQSSCRELLAAFIAKELEMNVAEPAIINVTPEFVDTLRGKEGYKHASNSIGLNFGTKYFGQGFFQFIRNQHLTAKQFEQAERIFALDIFISNADRNEEKRNMLTDGETIMIFDHELAFGFVMDIIKNPKPWIISEADKTWIKKHFFYPALRDNEHNFDNFVETFEVLDQNFWDKAVDLIPDEWKNEQVDQIKTNLTSLIRNKSIFLEELYKVLS